MSDQVYQWFVMRGRVALWIEQGQLVLQVDPEHAESCALNAQDVHDISGLLGVLAQHLWERGGEGASPKLSRYRQDGDAQYSWALDAEEDQLKIWHETSSAHVCIRACSDAPQSISLTMAVEVIQVLTHLESCIKSS
jgi:hypothetical protein